MLLTQASTACAATFSHLCKVWRMFPVGTGSMISSRGSTREQKPLEPRVSTRGRKRSPFPGNPDVERAVPGQRGRKTKPWKVPTAVPGLSPLPPPWGSLPSGRSLRPPTRLPPFGRSRSPQLLLLLLHMLQDAPSLLLAASGRGQTTPSPGIWHVLDRTVATPTTGMSDGDRPPCLVQEGIVLDLLEARPVASPAWGLKRHRKERSLPTQTSHWPRGRDDHHSHHAGM